MNICPCCHKLLILEIDKKYVEKTGKCFDCNY